MKERRLLVDFENVQQINLSKIADDFRVTIFVGHSQKTLPFELVQAAQCLGERVEWLRVDGSGNNALDFHIAYYLGCLFTKSPKMQCVILSKDSGFDPLVRHLNKKGFCCRRIKSLAALELQLSMAFDPTLGTQEGVTSEAKQAGTLSESNYLRVLRILKKIQQKSGPKRRATLANTIAAMFHIKLPQAEVERLIDLLFVEGKVVETNKKLSYHL